MHHIFGDHRMIPTKSWNHIYDPQAIIKKGDWIGSPTYMGNPKFLTTDQACVTARIFPIMDSWIGKTLRQVREKTSYGNWTVYREHHVDSN